MDFIHAFPADLSLETGKIQLRVLKECDFNELLPLSKSPNIFTWFTKDLSKEDELQQWVSDAVTDYEQERRCPFTIIDKTTNNICGTTSFGTISFYDSRIEIGWTWLGETYIGTGINTHAKFLLLQYAFESLHMMRVEIKTDNLNTRAKKALVKIGAREEGVLRNHMQMFNNRRRDSVYYSILKHEWDHIKTNVFAGVNQ